MVDGRAEQYAPWREATGSRAQGWVPTEQASENVQLSSA
jgi:hypothetical protein